MLNPFLLLLKVDWYCFVDWKVVAGTLSSMTSKSSKKGLPSFGDKASCRLKSS